MSTHGRSYLGWVFLGTIFIAGSATRLTIAQCMAPKKPMQERIAKYAAQKFHVDPSLVHVTSVERAEPSCFWAIHLTASSDRILTLYLSPDARYLAPDLYDLSKNPLEQERIALQKFSLQLLAKRSAEIGPPESAITIVEFSDLQCPYCRRLSDSFREMQAKGQFQDVKVVFKNFPLPLHEWAQTAAIIGECVRKQDETLFWSYQDFVFQNQEVFGDESLLDKSRAFLEQSGRYRGDLRACASDPNVSAEIEKDVALGRSIGIRSTPTFFVNGERYEGTRSPAQLEAIIREARDNPSLSSR